VIPRILLIEDDFNLQEALRLNLEIEGYEVVTLKDSGDALTRLEQERFNLVILDVILSGTDGYEICEQIRLVDFELPIFFITAKSDTKDVILGLKKGADDYLTKPFNLEEFLLRVKVLVKHSLKGSKKEAAVRTYEFGTNKINFITFEAKTNNGAITLTKKEAMLMKLLVDRKNEVVSRQQILQFVWGYDVYPTTRTIDNFILAFRKYFEKNPREPIHFHSIRGVGYKFTE